MLTDIGNRGLRRKAAKIIKKLNAAGPSRCLVREFHKPEVDWKVKSYDQLIRGLREEDMTPPSVTLDFNPEDVDVIANDTSKLGLDCLPHPVSRAVHQGRNWCGNSWLLCRSPPTQWQPIRAGDVEPSLLKEHHDKFQEQAGLPITSDPPCCHLLQLMSSP